MSVQGELVEAPRRPTLQGANPGDLGAILPMMRCPVDGNGLMWDRSAGALRDESHVYPIRSGIPFLFAPRQPPAAGKNDVTDIVKEFYEETPFPNYDGLDTRDSLRKKARSSVAGQLLDEQISKDATILEVGCGTGQMTNFLAMTWGRTVVGSDICFNSLRLATGFRDRFAIHNAHFVQMNLFDPFFKEHSFDVIISNGVLHHTADAEAAFHSISRMLKPGGYIVIGLYNWLGRLPTLWVAFTGRDVSVILPRCWTAACAASATPAAARHGSWTSTSIRTKASTRSTKSCVGSIEPASILPRAFLLSATRNFRKTSSCSTPSPLAAIWTGFRPSSRCC